MPKIEYPKLLGKIAYECFVHERIFGCRKWVRRDKMYTVSIVDFEAMYPNAPKQIQTYEKVRICADCYATIGYYTKRGKSKPVVDTTPDMFDKDDDDAKS